MPGALAGVVTTLGETTPVAVILAGSDGLVRWGAIILGVPTPHRASAGDCPEKRLPPVELLRAEPSAEELLLEPLRVDVRRDG